MPEDARCSYHKHLCYRSTQMRRPPAWHATNGLTSQHLFDQTQADIKDSNADVRIDQGMSATRQVSSLHQLPVWATCWPPQQTQQEANGAASRAGR